MSQVTTKVNNEKKTVKTDKPTASFSLLHAEITDALNLVGFGVPAKTNIPVLRGVILDTGKNRLTLRAFDYDTAVSVSVSAATPAGKGRSLLDHSELTKALAGAAAGETKAVAGRIPVSLAGDLISTPDVAVPITAHPIEEYPELPEPVPAMATVDGQTLLRQLARVLPSAGTDDKLPVLSCVQFTLEGGTLTLVTTDRYRLAAAELPAMATVAPPEKPVAGLVPARMLGKLAKRLRAYEGPVGVGIVPSDANSPARITLTFGHVGITIRPPEGGLPKFKSLIPTDVHTSVTVDRAILVRAVKKAAALIKAKGLTNLPGVMQWSESGTMTFAPSLAEPADQARVRGMEVPATLTHGAPVSGGYLGLNPSFLLEPSGASPATR